MSIAARQRGAVTIYLTAFIAMVLFGLLVLAVDLGRQYLIQGELQTVADNAAMAAATQLVGSSIATANANAQWAGALDLGDANDNRFNLRMAQILGYGGTDNLVSIALSPVFFALRADALSNSADGPTSATAKYARVQICAQAPLLFTKFLIPPGLTTGASDPCSTIVVSAVAGISAPICTACGINVLAVVDPSAGNDPINFGMAQGNFYTLYLSSVAAGTATTSQQTEGSTTCTASTPTNLTGTDTGSDPAAITTPVPYVILDHVPTGGLLDPDGTLYELTAAGTEQTDSDTIGPSQPPSGGVATVGGPQGGNVGVPEEPFGTYTFTGVTPLTTNEPGMDVICGLNTLFGPDLFDPLANACGNTNSGSVGAEFEALALTLPGDTDPGTGAYAAGGFLEDYGTEYTGNGRRVITVPVVDAVTTLNVQGFRQFLIEGDSSNCPSGGLNPSTTSTGCSNPAALTGTTCQTGAFPAQYIGWPVPLRCGSAGGMCSVSYGVGRTVLHCGTPTCIAPTTASSSGP